MLATRRDDVRSRVNALEVEGSLKSCLYLLCRLNVEDLLSPTAPSVGEAMIPELACLNRVLKESDQIFTEEGSVEAGLRGSSMRPQQLPQPQVSP